MSNRGGSINHITSEINQIMNFSEILNICQQLHKDGKEPSVALIKSRLSRPQPLPQIINGLKQWRNNPNKTVIEDDTAPTESPQNVSLEQRVETLEATVKQLLKEIEQLKQRGE